MDQLLWVFFSIKASCSVLMLETVGRYCVTRFRIISVLNKVKSRKSPSYSSLIQGQNRIPGSIRTPVHWWKYISVKVINLTSSHGKFILCPRIKSPKDQISSIEYWKMEAEFNVTETKEDSNWDLWEYGWKISRCPVWPWLAPLAIRLGWKQALLPSLK